MEQVRHVTTSASLQTTGNIVEHKSDVNAELEKLNTSIDRVEKDIEDVSLKIDEKEGKLEQTTDGSSQQTFEQGWLITLGKKEAALRKEKAALRKEKERLLQKRDEKSDGASSKSDVNAELERVNNDIVALAEKIDKEKGALVQATGAGNLALQAIYQTSLDKLWERAAVLDQKHMVLLGRLGSHSHGASSSPRDRLSPPSL